MREPLRGLTWDHPRGFGPLDELARRGIGPAKWDRQPLEGFESAPLAELAERFDLLVIDHPHIADAVEAGALVPLEDVLGADRLEQIRRASAGPSFESYRYRDTTWALPLDAATQVAASRPGGPLPETWSDVLRLAERSRVTLCLAGPHAFLTLLAVLSGMGAPIAERHRFSERDALREALALLGAVAERSIGGEELNPIRTLELLARGHADLCPLVYGYSDFSGPVRFGDAPRARAGGVRGSVLGGTGLAVSSRAQHRLEEVRAVVTSLAAEDAHEELIPMSGGHPATAAGWRSEAVDARSAGFFGNTVATLESAWVRPRVPGWPRFQDSMSAAVRAVLRGEVPLDALIDQMEDAYSSLRGEEQRWST